MRTLFVLMCLVSAHSGNSQSSSNESELNKLISSMPAEYLSSVEAIQFAEAFEQLTNNEESDWISSYCASYSYVMAAFLETNPKAIDKFAQKAKAALDHMSYSEGDQSEIYCLRSLIASAQIMVDPGSRGMKYGMESASLLEKAKAANPNNPRVYLIEGQGLLYIPAEYGGGCKNALPILQIAQEKFEAYDHVSSVIPNWGKKEVSRLIGQCESQ